MSNWLTWRSKPNNESYVTYFPVFRAYFYNYAFNANNVIQSIHNLAC